MVLNRWVRRGMLVLVIVLTYLFFIPGHGLGVERTYSESDDCGLHVLKFYYPVFSISELKDQVGHEWMWWEDFERFFTRNHVKFEYGVLGVNADYSISRPAILLYQEHWYIVYDDFCDYFGCAYSVWSNRGFEGLDKKDMDGLRVMEVGLL